MSSLVIWLPAVCALFSAISIHAEIKHADSEYAFNLRNYWLPDILPEAVSSLFVAAVVYVLNFAVLGFVVNIMFIENFFIVPITLMINGLIFMGAEKSPRNKTGILVFTGGGILLFISAGFQHFNFT